MKKTTNILTLSLSTLAIIGAFIFWKVDEEHSSHDHHHEHDHEHEEYVVLTDEQLDAAGIILQKAQPGNLQKMIQSPGIISINKDRIIHIYPKLEGIAKEAKKNLGESVEADEVIALLESREIAEAKTTYLTALKKSEQMTIQLEQEKNLLEKNVSSLQDFQKVLHKTDEAFLNLQLANQKLHILGLSEVEIANLPMAHPSQLTTYEIKAPLQGTVLSRDITAGEYLKTDHETYVIGDLSSLWIDLSFYPQDLPYVNKGQMIDVTDANGLQGKAQILYLCPVIDEDTHRAKAIASLDNNEGQWHPGTFVTTSTPSTTIPVALAITKESVQNIDGEDCAFIYTEKGFEIRPIKLGRCDGNHYEVLSGIHPNEIYASKNTFLLKADHKKDEAEHEH